MSNKQYPRFRPTYQQLVYVGTNMFIVALFLQSSCSCVSRFSPLSEMQWRWVSFKSHVPDKLTHNWCEPFFFFFFLNPPCLPLIFSLPDAGSVPTRLCYHSATWAPGGWQPNFGSPSASLGGAGGSGQEPANCCYWHLWPGQRSAGTALQLGSGEWESCECIT